MIILYSTGCPKCKVLKKKLELNCITFEEVSDIDIIKEKGISTVPVLEVDNVLLNFKNAINWINNN